MPPPLKRAKRRPTSALPAVSHENAQKCHLLRLPLEILAEILSYTRPPELLSLARTSKDFCRMLCDPGSSFMWKQARIDPDFLFVIPDPPPYMPEPAYAAMIFDSGKCYICQRYSGKMFRSYAYRARLCSRVRSLTLPHNVYTEKILFRERVQDCGVGISTCVSLFHRTCNPHLIVILVLLVSVPLVLVAANSPPSRIRLSSSRRCLRKPMVLSCTPLHSVRQFIWIPWSFQGASRVSIHVHSDTRASQYMIRLTQCCIRDGAIGIGHSSVCHEVCPGQR